MIYIIDDKKSRQIDYGWDETLFAKYQDIVFPIWDFKELEVSKGQILQDGNIILFHESFFSSCNQDRKIFLEDFKEELIENENLYVVFFSGSKNSRYVAGRLCMLPPNVLYENLELFIKSSITNDVNLSVLAFGKNFTLEEDLRNRLIEINNQNAGFDKLSPSHSIFFAAADTEQELEVEPPFRNIIKFDGWDNFSSDISDTDLDELVHQWFDETHYDAIYIPLSFGNILSDFIGLRLAMHIRLTPTINDKTPIFIYGVATYEEIIQHECLDILKTSSVHLIGCDNESFLKSLQVERREEDISYINKIHLNLPSNLGDNHSVANKWAISRWTEMINLNRTISIEQPHDLIKSLYFKYLVAKYRGNDSIKEEERCNVEIEGIEGKTIAYIDDEYDKGWENIIREIVESNGAKLVCFKGFDKKSSREELLHRIYTFIKEYECADCYLVDLRLHEDDFYTTEKLTGHLVSQKIKEHNKGNQIIVFTASNKIWNLKEEVEKNGATAYILKESPELNLKWQDSLSLYDEFANALTKACSLSYLKSVYTKLDQIKHCLLSSNFFGEKIKEIVAHIDVAFDLLTLSYEKKEYKSYSYLQLFLIIEEYVKLPSVIYETATGLYLENGNERYRLLKDRQLNGNNTYIYDSSIVMENGHYILKKGQYKNRFVDTNFLVSALLIFKFSALNSSKGKWTNIYKTRNLKAAHPQEGEVSIEDLRCILDFMLYIFDKNNENWRPIESAFEDINESDLYSLLKEKFSQPKK